MKKRRVTDILLKAEMKQRAHSDKPQSYSPPNKTTPQLEAMRRNVYPHANADLYTRRMKAVQAYEARLRNPQPQQQANRNRSTGNAGDISQMTSGSQSHIQQILRRQNWRKMMPKRYKG